MGRITFSEENKRTSSFKKLPKIKLAKDEIARIAIYEDPMGVYVHNIRKPKIENGKPVTKINDKEEREYVFDFVSNPICLGDESILDDKGLDTKNCVICEAHKDDPEMFEKPRYRMIMNVLKYNTDAKGLKASTPFHVENLVWSFTERGFSNIVDAFAEYIEEEGSDAVKKHDLILKCTNANFQNYDLNVSTKSLLSASDANRTTAKETIKANRFSDDDLRSAAGREKELKWLNQDIEDVRTAWRAVGRNEGASAESLVESSAPVEEDLNSLLSDDDEDEAPFETKGSKALGKKAKEEEESLADLLSDDDDDAPKDVSDDEDEDDDIGSFADLLADD